MDRSWSTSEFFLAALVPRGGAAAGPQLDPKLSDIYPAVRGELGALDALLRDGTGRSSGLKRAHLADLRHRIEQALNPKS